MSQAVPSTLAARAAGAVLLGAMLATSALADRTSDDRRAAPPEAASCARDHLTLYSGLVTAYRREPGQTTLRIRTDWGTTETVRVPHPGGQDPSRWFLIERVRFTAADWVRIEASPGKLKPAMRAAAWVCDNGPPPIIDWQPPRQP